MKCLSKTILIGFIALSVVVSGCSSVREIKLSEDVKSEVLAKSEDNKVRNEPVLKKKLEGLENRRILCWIDNENILTADPNSFLIKNGKVNLYSYNLESGESTQILNDSNITRIYDYKSDEREILLGNDTQAFIFDPKEEKLEEVLDIDKEFPDGIPGVKVSRERQKLLHYSLRFIKQGCITYASKAILLDKHGLIDKAEFTILNYKDGKKYTVESRYSAAGLTGKFDLTGKKFYIQELDKIIKLNLETGEKSTMKLSNPRIRNVFEDGTLFVECTEESKTGSKTGSNNEKWYKVNFDNNEVTQYDENYDSKNLDIDEIDFKNEFVGYTYLGDKKDEEKFTPMYGKLEGNKFVVKDKLFKNNEEKESCNTRGQFIFSPDHNKFITGVVVTNWQSPSSDNLVKNDEYLFELE